VLREVRLNVAPIDRVNQCRHGVEVLLPQPRQIIEQWSSIADVHEISVPSGKASQSWPGNAMPALAV
jgi:hypothetical protein